MRTLQAELNRFNRKAFNAGYAYAYAQIKSRAEIIKVAPELSDEELLEAWDSANIGLVDDNGYAFNNELLLDQFVAGYESAYEN